LPIVYPVYVPNVKAHLEAPVVDGSELLAEHFGTYGAPGVASVDVSLIQ